MDPWPIFLWTTVSRKRMPWTHHSFTRRPATPWHHKHQSSGLRDGNEPLGDAGPVRCSNWTQTPGKPCCSCHIPIDPGGKLHPTIFNTSTPRTSPPALQIKLPCAAGCRDFLGWVCRDPAQSITQWEPPKPCGWNNLTFKVWKPTCALSIFLTCLF